MIKPLISLVSVFVLTGISGLAQAKDAVPPTVPEATSAIVDMFSGSGLPTPSKVKLGTCIAAVAAKYPGQVACTVAITVGAAVNENQLDFYQQGKKWKAQPSVSQDKLPFPDPKLN